MESQTGNTASRTLRPNKGQSLLELLCDYTVIDLETTGLDPKWDDIIEVCAFRVRDGEIESVYTSLVNPGFDISGFITNLTGISNEMLSGAPSINTVLPAFRQFIGDDVVVGHNVNFDVNFVYDHSQRLDLSPFSNAFVDTMRIARRLCPELTHHRLKDLVKHYQLAADVKHRAQADVELTNSCYCAMRLQIESDAELQARLSSVSKYRWVRADDLQAQTDNFDPVSTIYGMTFAFTGTLERMIRKDAMQAVLNCGGLCTDGVNKNTNYLVLGNNDYVKSIKDGKSSKQQKAEKMKLDGHDIEIITEDVFYDMLRE